MRETIRAIIIDDEQRARRVLAASLKEINVKVDVVAEASNVPAGVLEINKLKPDVVFLDIEMPDYSGFELLGFFKQIDFEIIFVTAYNQYAIQAFEVSAMDYLLKPVRIDLLEKSVSKLEKRLLESSMPERLDVLKANITGNGIEKIAIPVAYGLDFIKVAEISHIVAEGSYASVFLDSGTKILVSKKLKYFEDILIKRNSFYRVHRSTLVNLSKIKQYNRNECLLIMEKGQKIKVSRDGKAAFESHLKTIIG